MHLPLATALVVKCLFWLLALVVFFRLFVRQGDIVDPRARQMLGAMVLGVLAGSKLVYLIGHPGLFLAGREAANDWLLGMISGDSTVGALVGGRLALWVYERGVRTARLADAVTVPVVAALLILGCGSFFWSLRGDGFGSPTSMPWGINFGDGAPRHPVMLYEAGFLGAILWLHHHYRTFDAMRGGLAQKFIVAYCAFRLAIGFLKPPFNAPLLREALEPSAFLYAGLMTAEQWLCCATLLVAVPLLRASERAAAQVTPGK